MCIGELGFAGRPVPAAADAAGLHRAGLRLRGRHALLRRRRADHLRALQAAVRVTVSLAFDRIVRVRVGDWLDFGLGDLIAACVCVCAGRSQMWILTGWTRMCISSRGAAQGELFPCPFLDMEIYVVMDNYCCYCHLAHEIGYEIPFEWENLKRCAKHVVNFGRIVICLIIASFMA